MLGAVVAFPVAVVLVHEPRKPGNEQNDTGDDYQGQPPLDTCSVHHSRHKLQLQQRPHRTQAVLRCLELTAIGVILSRRS